LTERKKGVSYMSKLLAFIIAVTAAVSIYSQDSSELNKRGLKHFERGEYDSAIADFTHAIELSSKLTEKPDTGLRKNFNGESTVDTNEVTVIDPLTAAEYVNRGKAYFAKGQFDSEVSDYDHALTITPAMTSALLCRGIARVGKNQLDL